MAKFYGAVGFVHTKPSGAGIWAEDVTERKYYGDVTRNVKRPENGEGLNDNVVINNIISIVADTYASQNMFAIQYVNWMGVNWKVASVESQSPRLILTLGGVYNKPEN